MKTAFVTMDVESFYDTSCVKNKEITGSISCAEQVDEFLSFLQEYNIKATLFVTADFIKQCKGALLRAISEGHEIALHALEHETPVNYTKEYFKECIVRAKEIIFNELGVEVKGYRAPCFGVDVGKVEVLKKQGFLYDSSALNFNAAYGSGRLDISNYKKISDCVYRDGNFFEVKPCTLSGGGYVRLTPWFIIKAKLNRYFKRADAYVFYVHPFELYKGKFPEYKQLSLLERTFINRGRKSYLRKIKYVFDKLKRRNFKFETISGYLRERAEIER